MQMTRADVLSILVRLFALAVPVILIGVPVGAIVMKRKGSSRLRAVMADGIANTPAEGPVVYFRFHTYHGLIVFVVETTHELRLPVSQAREVLRGLHQFNGR